MKFSATQLSFVKVGTVKTILYYGSKCNYDHNVYLLSNLDKIQYGTYPQTFTDNEFYGCKCSKSHT